MNKAKGKGKHKDKGSDKGKGKAKVQPGILLSWEDWCEEAMHEYMDAITEQVGADLDELEQALRSVN